ncbi:FAD-binding oxidoreductase [Cytophagales bacterium RKSG123]|nr:FAD-binding oxidoreductase [Xanthovirga aplysinae]
MSTNKTFRSIFKWGDPKIEEKLNATYQKELRSIFGLSDEDISKPFLPGNNPISTAPKSKLNVEMASQLEEIVGKDNIDTSDYGRAAQASGKFYTEILSLREGKMESVPDVVLSPQTEAEVIKIVEFCHAHKIAITPAGAKSSVTKGIGNPLGGVSLDLTKHLNKVIELDETSQIVRVQPGIYGPAFEEWLNKRGYTCGHFPQSFEYSTVGGWVAAKGAGQCSSGYGKIEDMVLGLKVVTPTGVIDEEPYPAKAQGWDLSPVFIGSEGTLGVITEVRMKVRKYRPENRRMASFLFKDFQSAVEAMRQISQNESGLPHLFRISDPEETEIAFRTKGFNGTNADKFLKWRGYQPEKRCLMFCASEGDADYTRLVINKVKKIAKQNGAFSLGAKPTRSWLEQRFHSAYLREPMMDLGLMTDTIETATSWENLPKLWSGARKYIKSRPNTLCMVHISHVYENGANLYFIFVSPIKKEEPMEDYKGFHKGLVDSILEHGGSLSHHHGVGRALAPWMEKKVGTEGMDLMRAIKKHLDPNNIMNPGNTLGLDLDERS